MTFLKITETIEITFSFGKKSTNFKKAIADGADCADIAFHNYGKNIDITKAILILLEKNFPEYNNEKYAAAFATGFAERYGNLIRR